MAEFGQEFLQRSRDYLQEQYLPKIERCLERLDAEDLWWRPDEASNSVGNLVLHLAGNARQWIVAGVAGREDLRERAAEFAADGGGESEWTGERLLAHLDDALREVDDVLAELDPTVLDEPRVIQGVETTVLGAVYHVVEHFAMHTGQILWITKARSGEGLGFYTEDPDGTIRTHW